MADDLHKTDLKGLNEDYLHIDPLKETYRESIIDTPQVEKALQLHMVALMVIDMRVDHCDGL